MRMYLLRNLSGVLLSPDTDPIPVGLLRFGI
jgi:hypothetical protein